MISGWMTFPSVFIPTLSPFHSCTHTQAFFFFLRRSLARRCRGATATAPKDKQPPAMRAYLPLTPVMQVYDEMGVFLSSSCPSVDLVTLLPTLPLTSPRGIYQTQRASWSDCPPPPEWPIALLRPGSCHYCFPINTELAFLYAKRSSSSTILAFEVLLLK